MVSQFDKSSKISLAMLLAFAVPALAQQTGSQTNPFYFTPTPGAAVQSSAAAAGGWTPKWFIAANSPNATNLKTSAGIVHAVQAYGISTGVAWLKFYDKATAPSCGSDTVVKQIMIPTTASAPFVLDVQFTTGISYCVVSGILAADNSSPAASNFVINIDWN